MSPSPSDDDFARTELPGGPGSDAERNGHALPAGYRLQEYELDGLLGDGGFGIVYMARDLQLQRVVAIKEYMPSSLAVRGRDHSVVARSGRSQDKFDLGLRSFVNEARLLASFDHPNLVKVYRFWEQNGTAYMVMPYYRGPTLAVCLHPQPGAPAEAWLKSFVAPLLGALELIHADRCYHRDIAPDNILLLGPGRPLLLDFGAARRVIGDATRTLTVILKPGYAPIEQYAEGRALKQGPWTDVYALCAVLYWAIAGRPPPAAVARLVSDDWVPASQLGAGRYSAALLAGIDAGLALQPDARPQSMAVLRALLLADAPAAVATTKTPASRMPEATAPVPTPAVPVLDDAVTGTGPAPTGEREAEAQMPDPELEPGPEVEKEPTSEPEAIAAPPAIAAPMPSAARRTGPLWTLVAAAIAVISATAWWWTVERRSPLPTAPPAPPGQSAERAEIAPAPPPSPAPTDTAPALTDTAPAATANVAAATAAAPDPSTAPAPAATQSAVTTRAPFSIAAALEDLVSRADPRPTLELTPNKPRLVIGRDELRLRVVSSQAGYLYVLLAGTEGSDLVLLFPNAKDANNRIEAGKPITLPRRGTRMASAGPPGVNHIAVIVSPAPRDFSAVGLKPGSGALAEFDVERLQQLWSEPRGGANALAGTARCEGAAAVAPCDQRYAAALARVEEVAP